MSSLRPFSVFVFLVSSLPAIAHAAPLATATVGANNGAILQCVVTNVGDAPATITSVTFYGLSGAVLNTTADTCTGQDVASHADCIVIPQEDTAASCVVIGKGKLRAGIAVYDPSNGNALVTFVPATAK